MESTATTVLPTDHQVTVRPGEASTADEVGGWLRDYAAQTARVGLIAAVDRYQPGRRGGFVPFAVACVVRELKRYLRDTSWGVHVPRPLKERTVQLCRAADELQQALGRSPSTVELANHLRLTVEEVRKELGVVMSRREISLDRPVGEHSGDRLGDLLATRTWGGARRTCSP